MAEPVVSDYEYRQRVRRYKPSSLVPLIAAAAARYWQQQDWLNSPYRKYTPWALADAARVSLALGNEHRPDATGQDLLQVLNAYSRFDDPFLRDKDVHRFLLRMAGQQMTWQVPEYETVARTAAIFEQTTPLQPMECLRPGWDTGLFGCTLREYMGTTQLAWASAISCAGRFDPAVFDTPDGKLITRHVGRDTVARVLDAHFAASVARFRADDQEAAARPAGTAGCGGSRPPAAQPSAAYRLRRGVPVPGPLPGPGQGHPVGCLLHGPEPLR
jgi:hypothetical protein